MAEIVLNVEIVEVDPIDGEVEIWFNLNDGIQYIMTLKNNCKPNKIFKRIELSEFEAKMVRVKNLEGNKTFLFEEFKKLTGGVLQCQ